MLIVITNIAVFAQTEKKPQTALAVEPKRTETGIEYNLYLENTNCLSTLFFEMNFDSKNAGKAIFEKMNALTYCIQFGIPTTRFL